MDPRKLAFIDQIVEAFKDDSEESVDIFCDQYTEALNTFTREEWNYLTECINKVKEGKSYV